MATIGSTQSFEEGTFRDGELKNGCQLGDQEPFNDSAALFMFFHDPDNFSVQKFISPYDVLGSNMFSIADTYQDVTLYESASHGRTFTSFRCRRCDNQNQDSVALVATCSCQRPPLEPEHIIVEL